MGSLHRSVGRTTDVSDFPNIEQRSDVTPSSRRRSIAIVFSASFLILFLELALIRWIPGHVRVVSYFTNLVLLACFLGMGVGCLLVRIRWPIVRLASFLLLAILLLTRYFADRVVVPVAGPSQEHFWLHYADLAEGVRQFGIPTVLSIFFVLVSLLFVTLGHPFGQAFQRLRGLTAYSVDILGSLAGTLGFAALSHFEAPPWVWFIIAGLILAALLDVRRIGGIIALAAYVAACVLIFRDSGNAIWSRYYRITTVEQPFSLSVFVNSSFHQMAVAMTPDGEAAHANIREMKTKFSVPYSFVTPRRVLILGAGTGNDVLVARANGAGQITAVEIDPAIARLGREKNTARPYDADNVRLVIDDARSFLKKTNDLYDLIIFGTLDSQALLGGVGMLRLENFVYTRECFEQVKRHLAPGGVVATYYFVSKPWMLAKLIGMMHDVFGQDPAVVTFRDKMLFNAILLEGGSPSRPFPAEARARAKKYVTEPDLIPTDDWPFLYMNARQIPRDSLWVIGVGLVWTLLLVGAAQARSPRRFSPAFAFLGAGFMLLEAKGVTEMSLLFGSTWIVNALVISAILGMILLANLVAIRWPMRRVEFAFLGVAVCLAIRGIFPVEALLRESGPLQTALAVLRVGAPVFFAALIFASLFTRTVATTAALGANLVGAMVGGFSEPLCVAFGLRALDWLALGFYAAAYLTSYWVPREPAPAEPPGIEPVSTG